MNTGKELRLRRFTRRGGAVIVPLDHAMFTEPVPAIRDLRKIVTAVAATEADGILVTPGMLEYVRPVIGDLGVILRIDGTHTRLGKHLERTDLICTVEGAVALGADMVVLNVFVGADNEDVLLHKLGMAATECRKYGMPLMAEMLPVSIMTHHYGKGQREATAEEVGRDLFLASRVGAEYGCDVIKTQYSGDRKGFAETCEGTPVPIWLAGGPRSKASDKEFLEMIAEAVDAGARGAIIGRNVWQRKDPGEMIDALCRILHR